VRGKLTVADQGAMVLGVLSSSVTFAKWFSD
jgi:hypothetical protein